MPTKALNQRGTIEQSHNYKKVANTQKVANTKFVNAIRTKYLKIKDRNKASSVQHSRTILSNFYNVDIKGL